MATIKPESGILNIEGILQQYGKDVLTKHEWLVFSGQKIKASANISANKIVVVSGYDEDLVTGEALNDFNQIVIGISQAPIDFETIGDLITKGIFETNLNGTGLSVGDPIYCTASGDLSFVASSKKIGYLLSTTINALIYVDIKTNIGNGTFALKSFTRLLEDDSTNIATTEYVDLQKQDYLKDKIQNFIYSSSGLYLWTGLAYGKGLIVGVGHEYTTRSTSNGKGSWTNTAQANQWTSVTYGNGIFVAVSSNGTNRVMTSPDGITWTLRTASEANYWGSVTYGNGLFVAVASSGTNRVMTSPDGITWTSRTAALEPWYSVTYGNGTFVAIAFSGTNRVMTSPDGITWTTRATTADEWWSVIYGNGVFVAVGRYGVAMRSTDNGITWNTINTGFDLRCVAYRDGVFAAAGTNKYCESYDGGLTWTDWTIGNGSWNSIVATHVGFTSLSWIRDIDVNSAFSVIKE